MFKRRAFTLIEVLIVIIILGILAAAIIPQFTSAADDGRTNSTAMVVRAMMRKISAEKAKSGSFSAAVTASMFEGNTLPRNPLFPSVTDPDFGTVATDSSKYHPATKTSATDTVWWYNSGNGVVRALIPNTGTDAEKIAQYNAANITNITALDDE